MPWTKKSFKKVKTTLFFMGRIRTVYIKRKSKEVLKENSDKFNVDFKNNKKQLDSLADIPSKKLRNKMAGCITHMVKTTKTPEVQ